MFDLAGEAHPRWAAPREVPVAVRNLPPRSAAAAYVMDAKYEVLAWNDLATVFIGDMSAEPPERRNVIRWMFTAPRPRPTGTRTRPWPSPLVGRRPARRGRVTRWTAASRTW